MFEEAASEEPGWSIGMLKAYLLKSFSRLRLNVSFAFTSLQHPRLRRLKRLLKRSHDAMPPLMAP